MKKSNKYFDLVSKISTRYNLLSGCAMYEIEKAISEFSIEKLKQIESKTDEDFMNTCSRLIN